VSFSAEYFYNFKSLTIGDVFVEEDAKRDPRHHEIVDFGTRRNENSSTSIPTIELRKYPAAEIGGTTYIVDSTEELWDDIIYSDHMIESL
jgi:hypothetical protein